MSAVIKSSMRESLKELRSQLFGRHPNAGEKVADQFFSFFNFKPKSIIGVYWPLGSELDSRPLLHRLYNQGYTCALPRVTEEGLVFHPWEPSLQLEKGNFGIQVPSLSTPILEPEVVIVPLLGFDRAGHRIGYGKGHYDKYLHNHEGIFIGIGFAGQEVDRVPHELHDIPLHFIVTEEGVILV